MVSQTATTKESNMEKPEESPQPEDVTSEPNDAENIEEPDVDPEPEEGDFYDELPLDERTDDDNKDGDDNDVAEELRGE